MTYAKGIFLLDGLFKVWIYSVQSPSSNDVDAMSSVDLDTHIYKNNFICSYLVYLHLNYNSSSDDSFRLTCTYFLWHWCNLPKQFS